MGKNRIIVFVKNPILGKVKTRLAKTMGNKEALNVYTELVQITKRQVEALSAEKEVWYAWEIGTNDLWDDFEFKKRVQIEGDLGEKMKHGFKTAFEEGCKKVILIGSDCPTLTTQILENAFHELENNDMVLGPSKDGGYYLIGMNAFYPCLFNNISWSTDIVLKQTEEIAKNERVSLVKLSVLNDIDNESDWNAYLQYKD